MKRILKYNSIVLMALLFFIFSCDKEDYTGDSQLVPTSPTATITVANSNMTLVEQDKVYDFVITLSGVQISDVIFYVTVLEGATATLNTDFTIENTGAKVRIPAGKTTGTASIKVLADELIESQETFSIQIGDERTANVSFTPAVVNFTVDNDASGDLEMHMSWSTENPVFDTDGEELGGDDVADLIFSIEDASGTVVGVADGGSFEDYVLSSTLADGVYTLKALFYGVLDLGDFSTGEYLDVTLDFFQPGVLSKSLSFSSIMTTAAPCDFEATLATVTKSGSSYTIASIGTAEFAVDYSKFVGSYGGADGSYGAGANWMFAADITMTDNGTNLDVDGVNFGWMPAIWGETVTSTIPFKLTLNADGTLTIADQYYMTTDWEGTAYDYNISGTGTWSSCSPSTMIIHYDIGGLGPWLLANGYSYTDYFIADIELGAKSAKKATSPNKIVR